MPARIAPSPSEGLRERKKRLTRAALAANAQRMFSERGFDQVTVAEIAELSNVSVKTLFVYFASKEDLVFADEYVLLEQMRERLGARAPGSGPSAAIRALAHDLIGGSPDSQDNSDGIVAFARLVGDHPALHSRLQLMWERYEQGLAESLAAEHGASAPDPRTRATAALLITPFRVLTSSDVRTRATAADVVTWIDTCFDLVEAGIGG